MPGYDVVTALSGHDLIDQGAGDDWADAGQGDDAVYGGIGNDTLYSGGSNDLPIGGDRDDHVRNFGASGGTLQGGGGTDVVEFRATNSQRLVVDLGAGLMDGGSSYFPGVTLPLSNGLSSPL